MRFAVIGAGVIGRLRARSIQNNPESILTAVADTDGDAARLAAGHSGAQVCADYRTLLDDSTIEAFIISTPVQLHESLCVAALEAGKHVLCEKPLSNSVESCRRILETAAQYRRRLAVGFNHRFYPAVKFLKKVVDQGRIGVIDHLRVFGGHDGLANFRADWMYKSKLSGGGAMMDVGIHMTDLARFVAGEIRKVYGISSGNVWGVEGSEDNALAIFKTQSGIPIHFQATWNEWKGYRIFVEAYGNRGMVRAAYAPMFNLLITQDKPGGQRKRTCKRYPDIILREKLRGWQTTTLKTFEDELAEFLRMTAGENVALADGWSGMRAVEIAQAVYESNEQGTAVTLERP